MANSQEHRSDLSHIETFLHAEAPRENANTDSIGSSAQRSEIERCLVETFRELLRNPLIESDDGFLENGGDSLAATRLLVALRDEFGCKDADFDLILEAGTPAMLARRLTGAQDPGSTPELVLMRSGEDLSPMFLFHPLYGTVWPYVKLLSLLEKGRPIYGVQARQVREPEYRPSSFQDLADDYLSQIRQVQPSGPYFLVGWSYGGNLAHAVAVALQNLGEGVALLALIDAFPPEELGRMAQGASPEELNEIFEGGLISGAHSSSPEGEQIDLNLLRAVGFANGHTLMTYSPGEYKGATILLKSSVTDGAVKQPNIETWRPYVRGPLLVVQTPASHAMMLKGNSVRVIADTLNFILSTTSR